MPMSNNISGREYGKFVQSPTRDDGSAVEIVGNITASSSPFAPPSGTDAFTRSVSGNIETIEYRQGGITGTILKTIRVYYQNAPSQNLTAGEIL